MDPITSQSLADIDTTLVEGLSAERLDGLPHGAIQLDLTGQILKFNQYESALSRLPKETVIGRNFFTEVAPCTDVQEFRGRFFEGVKARKLQARFRYHFAFKQNPRNVLVTLSYSEPSQTVWVFVQPV